MFVPISLTKQEEPTMCAQPSSSSSTFEGVVRDKSAAGTSESSFADCRDHFILLKYQVIESFVREYPSATIGAGTVLSVHEAGSATQAGVKLLTSPVSLEKGNGRMRLSSVSALFLKYFRPVVCRRAQKIRHSQSGECLGDPLGECELRLINFFFKTGSSYRTLQFQIICCELPILYFFLTSLLTGTLFKHFLFARSF